MAAHVVGAAKSLARTLLRQLWDSVVVLLLMAAVLWLLAEVFAFGRQEVAQPLHLDAYGSPIFERFADSVGVSAKLIGGSLLISVPLGALVGWLSAASASCSTTRALLTVVSSVPVFISSYLFHRYSSHIFFPILALGFGDLTVSAIAAHVYNEMRKELKKDYIRTAKAKGASCVRHYWRRLVATIVSSVRPRIPFLIGGAVVAEQIFSLEGLGNLAVTAVTKSVPADINILVWVSAFSVLVVRALGLTEVIVRGLLLPPDLAEQLVVPFRERVVAFFAVLAPRRVLDGCISLSAAAKESVSGVSMRRIRFAAGEFPRRLSRSASLFWRQTVEYLRGGLAPRCKFGLALVFCTVCAMMIALCVVGWHQADLASDPGNQLAPLSLAHPFGTDSEGYDVLGNTLAAGRRLVLPALLGVLLPLLLGTLLGAIAGYSEAALVRQSVHYLMDLLDSVPKLIIVLAAIVVVDIDNYLIKVIPVMGLTFTPLIFYHVEERVRYLKMANFVEAQRAVGASELSILFRHVLFNNCKSILLVQGSFILGSIVLMDAAIGYLGLAQPDAYTWGALILNAVRDATAMGLERFNHWAIYCPMLAVLISTCSFTLLGEGFRVLFDYSGEG